MFPQPQEIQGEIWSSADQFWEEEEPGKDAYGLTYPQRQANHVKKLFSTYFVLPQGQICHVGKLQGYCTKNFEIWHKGVQEERQLTKYVFKAYRYIKRLPIHVNIMNSMTKDIYDSGLKIPKPVQLKRTEGRCIYQKVLEEDKFWKSKIIIRAITFVPGTSYSEFINSLIKANPLNWLNENLVQKSLSATACLLANIDQILEKQYLKLFENPNMIQAIKVLNKKECRWVVEEYTSWGSCINQYFFPDPNILNLLLYARQLVKRNVGKKNKHLRRQLIHNDCNQQNCFVEVCSKQKNQGQGTRTVSVSLIDFDDMIVCFLPAEIGNAIAHLLEPMSTTIYEQKIETTEQQKQQKLLNLISYFVGEYHRLLPLTDAQIGCLYYFVVGRLALLCVQMGMDVEESVGYSNIQKRVRKYRMFLERMLDINPITFQHKIRKTLNLQINLNLQPKCECYPYILEQFTKKYELNPQNFVQWKKQHHWPRIIMQSLQLKPSVKLSLIFQQICDKIDKQQEKDQEIIMKILNDQISGLCSRIHQKQQQQQKLE